MPTDLFGAEIIRSSKQAALFDMTGPRESKDDCPECGSAIVETVSGYWTCPRGCLKLIPQGGE